MTLRENIVKAKVRLNEGRFSDCRSILNDILDEMQEEEQTTRDDVRNDIRNKILRQIDKIILNDDPDGALTWAQVLSMFPS